MAKAEFAMVKMIQISRVAVNDGGFLDSFP